MGYVKKSRDIPSEKSPRSPKMPLLHREQDYVVKILSPIIGFLIKEFNIGTFELNWYVIYYIIIKQLANNI